MKYLDLSSPEFLRWRCWATDLRDGGGLTAMNARLLVRMLDLGEELERRSRQENSATNLADGLIAGIETMIGRLLAAGVTAPALLPDPPLEEAMPRYVLLEHDHPALHWDLMLEAGESLHTWRLAKMPVTGDVLPALRIGEHRLAYLDYEGPVSGDRGSVRRCDAGTFEWLELNEQLIVVRMEGGRLAGLLRLERSDGDAWLLQVDSR